MKFYVDNVYKGDMTLVNDEYWFYIWDVSGTQQGTHRLKVEACDNSACHNVGFVERDVYVKPQLDTDWIEWQNDHNLWLRDPNIPPDPPNDDGDIPITPPHWAVGPPVVTKPFAYTISATMTSNVHLVTPDTSVTGQVYIRYVVVNSWSDGHEDERRIKDKLTTLPTELAHQPPARPRVRPPYTLTQNYAFYVKRHANSDWACAGSRTVVHPQVFLTFRAPVGPWGPSAKPRACWSRVLNTACTWMPPDGYMAAQERDAMARLAFKAYWSTGKDYDGSGSSYRYYPNENSPQSRRFWLWQFITDSAPRYTDADCKDMALWWQKLCHAVGLGTDSRYIDGPFVYTWIDPVGSPGWTNGAEWNYHMIGWSSNVFDPCIQIDRWGDTRVPADEGLNNPYKPDLFFSGTWNPLLPFRLGDEDNKFSISSEVD